MASDYLGGASYGSVVIGRNEGERLRTCLGSVRKTTDNVVYVDSGSTDDSVKMALDMAVVVVELDMSIPFTAARARNEGFEKLCELDPEIRYVQFVDGDCEVVDNWIKGAVDYLEQNDQVAVVCGRRRERFPEKSVYNMLCDIEWDTPVGESRACGGDAMIRVAALRQVSGFRGDLIAGEEPELCVRLRQQGWKIWRLDTDMTLHDASMLKFSQWWNRNVRSGYAYAQGAHIHGGLPERHWVREARSARVWGLLIPLLALFSIYFLGLWSLVFLASYPLQVLRLTFKGHRGFRVNFFHSLFLIIAKFPELIGSLRFYLGHYSNSDIRLIEYK